MVDFWMVSIEPNYLITDAWTVGMRLLLLEGDPQTYLGMYSRNDEISFFVRYSF